MTQLPGIPSFADPRAIALEILSRWVGLTYPAEEYERLLYPNDSASARHQMARSQSSCALTELALWRTLGIDEPELAHPYAIGMAVAQVVAIARRRGAWRAGASSWPPSPGDAVVLTGPEHVLTVTGLRGDVLLSTDGGQPGISERAREIVVGAHGVTVGGRAVLGTVDLVALVNGGVTGIPDTERPPPVAA